MLFKYLILIIALNDFLNIGAISEKTDIQILEGKVREMGFTTYDFNFKKDFSVNDSFVFPLADTLLNNPLMLLKERYTILDSITKSTNIKKYDKIDDVFQLIDTFASDMNMIMRKHDKTGFDKSKELIQVIPMMFYDESLSYKYKGIIEQNINIDIDTNKLSADSLITFMYNMKTDFSEVRPYINNLKKRILELYSEGLLFPCESVISAGKVVIGDIGSNQYYEDYDFIIDLGGNDTYTNSGGVIYPYTMRTRFIIDFDGDDRYLSTDSFKISLGAVNGVQFAYDMSGNDYYSTGIISQGAAFIGYSSLCDESGDDIYISGIFSQGAGFYGLGEMTDISGNDFYTASCFAQGFGFVMGTGILIDSSGDDTYRAGTLFSHAPLLENDHLAMSQGFGLGIRPRTGGGIGILADYSGNDVYIASVFGQGGSYWHSIGLLFDFKGNDFYQSAEYAQGSGIHLSVGGLFDYAGDDMYFSRYGPSQGEGHDFAVGILSDKKGDDTYIVSGGQGGGLNNSVGILIDREGDDSYYSRENFACGDVNESRGFSGIGVFIDCEGEDFYTKAGERDSINWINKYYGIGSDAGYTFKDTFLDTFDVSELLSVDELFKIASEWEVRDNKYKIDKARKILFKREKECYNLIVKEKLGSEDGLELRCITEFLKASSEGYSDSLIKYLGNSNKDINRNVIYIFAEIKNNNAYPQLKEQLSSSDEKTRQLAVYAIGCLDTSVNLSYLKEMYKEKNYRIKVEVLEALRKHKYDLTEDFVKIIKTEKERISRQAISNYLSEFDKSLRLMKEGGALKNYEEYITIYKIISKDENSYLIKTYKDYLKNIAKKTVGDKANIKGIKKRIQSVIEKQNN